MSDKGQDRWIEGNEQSEVEGHGYADKMHEVPTGGGDTDEETPEVEGLGFRGAREAAEGESDRYIMDKDK